MRQGAIHGEHAAGTEQHAEGDQQGCAGLRAGLRERGVEAGQQQREHARGEHDAGAEAEQHALHAGADLAHDEQRHRTQRGRCGRHGAACHRARYGEVEALDAAHELGHEQRQTGDGDQPAAERAQGSGWAGVLEMQASDLVDHDVDPPVSVAAGPPCPMEPVSAIGLDSSN